MHIYDSEFILTIQGESNEHVFQVLRIRQNETVKIKKCESEL
jgi:16S rRNA U1498 N3-methylase RsmE